VPAEFSIIHFGIFGKLHSNNFIPTEMNFKLLIITILIVICNNSCQQSATTQNSENDSVKSAGKDTSMATNNVQVKTEQFLTIQGKDIWIRDLPATGKVVLKLNEGDNCKIIEKGKLEMIKGRPDYWYKIVYNQTEGWVFGSQTNLMLFKPITQPFIGVLAASCDDPVIQEFGAPSSCNYSFKQDQSFTFSVAAGYILEGTYEWQVNSLILNVLYLVIDSPEGSVKTALKEKITFAVFIKEDLVCLVEKVSKTPERTYIPSGGCFCIQK